MNTSTQICNFSHASLPGITLKISSPVSLDTPRDLDAVAAKLRDANLIPAGARGILRFRLDGDTIENATLIPLT